jgi:hypothetical protein
MSPTAFDRRLAARAAGLAALALAVAALVIAATDEGGPWSLRLGMLSALAPVAGTMGTLAALSLSAARGELRALAAIGVAPGRASAGAVTGGVMVGLAGPTAAGIGLGDLAALFPRPPVAHRWIVDGDGLRELGLGVRVGARGALALDPPHPASAGALPPAAVLGAVVMLAAAALVCPAWAAGQGPARRRAAVAVAAVALSVGAFQGVAAGRLPAAALLAAPLLLLLDGAAARYGARPR